MRHVQAQAPTQETPFEVAKTDEEWKAQLPADRYAVLRRAGTEPPWSGELLHVDGEGVFRCAGCGAELFDTDAKFESGTGWPSFDRARAAGTVIERRERSSAWPAPRSCAPGAADTSGTSSPTGRPTPGSATASIHSR